jgi:hypothetical protein
LSGERRARGHSRIRRSPVGGWSVDIVVIGPCTAGVCSRYRDGDGLLAPAAVAGPGVRVR